MGILGILCCGCLFFFVGSQDVPTVPETPTTIPAVCQAGRYGPNCLKNCGNCSPNTCDRVTGACQACAPGYDFAANNSCSEECPSGQYGAGCSERCSAQCNPAYECDVRDGSCSPCKPGYKGSLCTQLCDPSTYGQDCQGSCGNCAGNAECDKITGHCPAGCDPGYDPSDPLCERECPADRYGQNCTTPCSPNCKATGGRRCDKVSGQCQCNPGYQPPLCTASCQASKWGQDCLKTCSANCVDQNSCNNVNGYCTCVPGYKPSVCTDECTDGTYGQDCSQTCGFCYGGHTVCDHVTGYCPLCEDNREMPLCKDCIAGQWGPSCGQRCGQCGGEGRCDPLNGTCLSSTCLAGWAWTSTACDVKCSPGTYGDNCAQKCGHCKNNNPCRHDNGLCEQDCEDGYTGVLCQTEEERLIGPIVGSVLGAGALIAIAIVIAVFCYWKRRSDKVPQAPKKDFMELDRPGSTMSSQHLEARLSQRDSLIYQNVETGTTSGRNNYDQTNFSRQDTHAYAKHIPGKPPDSETAHTYQNTGYEHDDQLGRQNRGGRKLEAPEATYGNVEVQSTEGTYRNL